MIKKMAVFLLAIIIFLSILELSFAANSGNHPVTVTVAAINELGLSGGALTLTIDTAAAGSEPADAVDNTSCDLLWSTNEAGKKITVQTDLAAPNFILKVLAQTVSGGTAASEVTLSTTATDFVTGIVTTTGSCDLQYTANTTAAQGTGTDNHTITYTLTN